MGKIGNKLRKIASDWLDIPPDVAANVPRVLMVGPYRIHVENHRGVESFQENELILKTDQGAVVITGERLKIKVIYPEEIWVEGEISEVRLRG
ncbi:sporulation protein YqfC [Desmospora activa]|uniref:Sporulation protein YqfC n=1 Tax=Desmospora activa DSM 45169 TaxID=1121389 RepID=A0A2T4ZC61_9BACL|nr:sporulation protein YqfC [Desmospora activa]PTM59480.1 sporulation protein YqfC [Desmospora activa DSM 45169]